MDIAFSRLINQHIATDRFQTAEEVVKWMGAIQAQDYGQAVWAIGQRTKSATLADIEQAIRDRKIVRTWPMRGTIHFILAEEAKWMVKLSAARMLTTDSRRMERLGLDEQIMEQCKQLFYDALSGNRRLSRPDMMKLLEDAGISTKNQRGYHILWHSSLTGLLCQGPVENKQQTFVLLDEWVENSRELTKEESLAELAKRYFTSHGPATLHDFAWWGGLTVKDARLGLELSRSDLLAKEKDGVTYWMAHDVEELITPLPSSTFLLPGYDEYLLGYKDRSAVLAAEHAQKIVPGSNGIFLPTIIVEGQVVGTWKRKQKKNVVEITLSPFTPHDDLEERVMKEAKGYSDFLGLELSSIPIEACD